MRGVAALETLLAAPLVMLLGLSALQWVLVFHGYQAVSHAAIEGARAGSVAHASAAAVDRGLARGLAPWLFGASDRVEFDQSIERAGAELTRGRAAGWAAWRRLSPTRESFSDWAVAARDDDDAPIAGVLEIPNDNLGLLPGAFQPAGATAGVRRGDPIGAASAQTLADANMLKIEFTYGIPLVVPFVGRFAARVMQAYDGCADAPASLRLGPLELLRTGGPRSPDGGVSGGSGGAGPGRSWTCAHYRALDEAGRSRPRWPVRVSAAIRMQSAARDVDASPDRVDEPNDVPALDAGRVGPSSEFEPTPLARVNPAGAGPGADTSIDRAPGFLRMGADRLIEAPAMCTAP
ncbi:MAG: pilus assembly protein [Burkholderiaceae bacterium]|nr:pilus assembly protein [Burkholderiaceae bacterium]